MTDYVKHQRMTSGFVDILDPHRINLARTRGLVLQPDSANQRAAEVRVRLRPPLQSLPVPTPSPSFGVPVSRYRALGGGDEQQHRTARRGQLPARSAQGGRRAHPQCDDRAVAARRHLDVLYSKNLTAYTSDPNT